jgi:hemerythrin
MINRLYETMSEGHGKNVIKETLDEMIDDTAGHFPMD